MARARGTPRIGPSIVCACEREDFNESDRPARCGSPQAIATPGGPGVPRAQRGHREPVAQRVADGRANHGVPGVRCAIRQLRETRASLPVVPSPPGMTRGAGPIYELNAAVGMPSPFAIR
jgi:hypothetical protein